MPTSLDVIMLLVMYINSMIIGKREYHVTLVAWNTIIILLVTLVLALVGSLIISYPIHLVLQLFN